MHFMTELRDQLEKTHEDGKWSKTMFAGAQKDIFYAMKRDSYQRYLYLDLRRASCALCSVWVKYIDPVSTRRP